MSNNPVTFRDPTGGWDEGDPPPFGDTYEHDGHTFNWDEESGTYKSFYREDGKYVSATLHVETWRPDPDMSDWTVEYNRDLGPLPDAPEMGSGPITALTELVPPEEKRARMEANKMQVMEAMDGGWLPYLQGGLDVVGLVPGFGEVADGVNALIYLYNGDNVNAALSGAAMLPFIGWGATGAKLTTHGVKLAKKLASEAQMAEKGIPIIKSGNLDVAGRLAKQYGGNASDWVKKSSSSYSAKDGVKFETHWYENISNGQRVEYKTKFP